MSFTTIITGRLTQFELKDGTWQERWTKEVFTRGYVYAVHAIGDSVLCSGSDSENKVVLSKLDSGILQQINWHQKFIISLTCRGAVGQHCVPAWRVCHPNLRCEWGCDRSGHIDRKGCCGQYQDKDGNQLDPSG